MVFAKFAVIILTGLILFPSMVSIGYDPIGFGVIMCRMLKIGMTTQPIGLNLLGLAGSADVAVGNMYRDLVQFM